MVKMQDELRNLLTQALGETAKGRDLKQDPKTELEIEAKSIELTRPVREEHGDWTSNIALRWAEKLGLKPRDLAAKLETELKKLIAENAELAKLIIGVEIAGPGFLNFRLSPEFFFGELAGISADYGKHSLPARRIMVEYGHPNTHKSPHIGHLYSYVVGNSFVHLLGNLGHEIAQANYQGDVGPHVAKCIWGWQKLGKQEPESLKDKVKHLQECYQKGATAYEEDETAKAEITEINKQIYDPNSEIQADWLKTRQWSLDFYAQLEKRLGVQQRFHYLESQVWERGMELVRANVGKVYEESDGATVYKGEKHGLHTRVFITKYNTPTYECKDIGLNEKKMQDWPYDLTIISTASEQNGYFDVVIKAIGETVPELEGKIQHVGFGMVSLTTGKMSSRKGNILSAPELLEVVAERVAAIVKERSELSPKEQQEIVDRVSLAAVKYTFLRGNILQNMTFDLEESVAFDGNSGPYLLYTYARIKSVLRQEEGGEVKPQTADQLANALTLEGELNLIHWLARYPEISLAAGEQLAPHIVSTYLFELSQRFNLFYHDSSINSAETPELVAARRFLAAKTAEVIAAGLGLLGIPTVERM